MTAGRWAADSQQLRDRELAARQDQDQRAAASQNLTHVPGPAKARHPHAGWSPARVLTLQLDPRPCHRTRLTSCSKLGFGLDECPPSNDGLGKTPLFELIERAPSRTPGNPIFLGQIVDGRHLLPGLQLSVFYSLPQLVSYPQIGRLRGTGLAHVIMVEPGKPLRIVT
jgi:hypothetical protein